MTAPITRRLCRGPSCFAKIALVPTSTGGTIPLNAEPDQAGNVRIDDDLLGTPVAHVLSADGAAAARAEGVTLYMPHWTTCPDVDTFRR